MAEYSNFLIKGAAEDMMSSLEDLAMGLLSVDAIDDKGIMKRGHHKKSHTFPNAIEVLTATSSSKKLYREAVSLYLGARISEVEGHPWPNQDADDQHNRLVDAHRFGEFLYAISREVSVDIEAAMRRETGEKLPPLAERVEHFLGKEFFDGEYPKPQTETVLTVIKDWLGALPAKSRNEISAIIDRLPEVRRNDPASIPRVSAWDLR